MEVDALDLEHRCARIVEIDKSTRVMLDERRRLLNAGLSDEEHTKLCDMIKKQER